MRAPRVARRESDTVIIDAAAFTRRWNDLSQGLVASCWVQRGARAVLLGRFARAPNLRVMRPIDDDDTTLRIHSVVASAAVELYLLLEFPPTSDDEWRSDGAPIEVQISCKTDPADLAEWQQHCAEIVEQTFSEPVSLFLEAEAEAAAEAAVAAAAAAAEAEEAEEEEEGAVYADVTTSSDSEVNRSDGRLLAPSVSQPPPLTSPYARSRSRATAVAAAATLYALRARLNATSMQLIDAMNTKAKLATQHGLLLQRLLAMEASPAARQRVSAGMHRRAARAIIAAVKEQDHGALRQALDRLSTLRSCERELLRHLGPVKAKNARMLEGVISRLRQPPDRFDARLLELAVSRWGEGGVVRDLAVELGLNVNARGRAGRTALHAAAELGREDALVALLKLGASPSIVDSVGVSPLLLARLHGHAGIARLLAQRQRSDRKCSRSDLSPLPDRLIDYVALISCSCRSEHVSGESSRSSSSTPRSPPRTSSRNHHGGQEEENEEEASEPRIDLRCPKDEHIDFALPTARSLNKICAHSDAIESGRPFTVAIACDSGHHCYVACVRVSGSERGRRGRRGNRRGGEGGDRVRLLCLLSHWPFFAMHEALVASLAETLMRSRVLAPGCAERAIASCATALFLAPPGGSMQITFDAVTQRGLVRTTASAQRPAHGSFPALDARSAVRLLAALSAEDILEIVVQLAATRRVLCVAKSLGRLADVCEALRALLWPLRWSAPFIPVLPYDARNMLTAPVPYFIGVAVRGGVGALDLGAHPPFVIDLDEGTVTPPPRPFGRGGGGHDDKTRRSKSMGGGSSQSGGGIGGGSAVPATLACVGAAAAACIRDVTVAAVHVRGAKPDVSAVRSAFETFWARVFAGDGKRNELARYLEDECGAWSQLQPSASTAGFQRAAELERFAKLRRAVSRGSIGSGGGEPPVVHSSNVATKGVVERDHHAKRVPPPRHDFRTYRTALPRLVLWSALWEPLRCRYWRGANASTWRFVMEHVRDFLPTRESCEYLASLELGTEERAPTPQHRTPFDF